MQPAGNRCRVCGQNIVLSVEGKFCAHCGTFVHAKCAAGDNCDACGQTFQLYDPPTPDPQHEATIPRALRTPKTGGPVLALAALVLFLVFLAYFVLEHLIGSGD